MEEEEMWEYMKYGILVGIICIALLFIFVFFWCSRHKDFINNAKRIEKGMSKDRVLNIMGEPTSKENYYNKEIIIWEKRQWKGFLHGGTLTRTLKVSFINNYVSDISYKNFDKSTFW